MRGFEAASTNLASSPLEAPTNLRVKNGATGQFIVSVKRPKNGKSIQLRIIPVVENGTHGAPVDGGTHTDSRRMVVDDLMPSGNYLIDARGVGGSEKYSPWSDPMMKRSL